MLHEWAQQALAAAAGGGVTVFAALAIATLLTEDLTCIAAGLLVTQGAISFVPATSACFVGILSGDLVLVLIGRTLGRHSLRTAPLRWWISASMVARAAACSQPRPPRQAVGILASTDAVCSRGVVGCLAGSAASQRDAVRRGQSGDRRGRRDCRRSKG